MDFLQQIATFVSGFFDIVNLVIDSMVSAFSFLSSLTTFPRVVYNLLPGFIVIVVTISLGLSVINYIVGR